MHRLTKTAAAGCSAAVLLVTAPGAWGATLRGVVVHDNPRAHSFVVAQPGGVLKAIHAPKLPPLGSAVAVRARSLRNGTSLALHVAVGHRIRRVVVRGTVTYVAPGGHAFVLSARGASLLVRRSSAHVHGLRRTTDAGVAVGDIMTVNGSLDRGSISASTVEHDGQDANGIDLEGVVQTIDTTARTLGISADDRELSGATVTVQVPASFDLNLFLVGQSAELIVSPNPDGTYTLEQSSDDSGGHHADDPSEMQGDRHGDDHASAEQQCLAQAADPTFPAAHNGLSFTQFYENSPSDANNALGRCVDAIAQGDGHGSGSGDSSSGGSDGSNDSSSGGPGGSGD